MNDQYAQIKSELELTKAELEARLNRSCSMDRENFQSVAELYERERTFCLEQRIQAELEDVNRSLLKMEFGLFGLCEETGMKIPYEQLKVLPTVRTRVEAEVMTHFPYKTEHREYELLY